MHVFLKLGPKVASFPEDPYDYGIDVELLEKVHDKVKIQRKGAISWYVAQRYSRNRIL